ncbi:MAG: hypothetical protein QXS68_08530 [Candidatus Methanomethylicaceae archaeon]
MRIKGSGCEAFLKKIQSFVSFEKIERFGVGKRVPSKGGRVKKNKLGAQFVDAAGVEAWQGLAKAPA